MNCIVSKSNLNKKKASRIFYNMLMDLHPISGDMGYESFTDIVLPPGIFIKKDEEIQYIEDHGKANQLQNYYDQHDNLFGDLPSIGFISDVPDISVKLESTYLGKTQQIFGNGFIEKAEDSLSNDILYFKNLFITAVNSESYDGCFRSYRSYLLSCISLVELFLNRFVLFAQFLNLPELKEPSFSTLASQANMDDRMDAWIILFAVKNKNIKGNKEWEAFKKIKKARNDFVHSKNIGYGYQIKEIVEILNCSIDGIGGLLENMCNAYTGKGYLGFIQQIKNQGRICIEN